ncbi:MAG: MBOAT family protein [Myxococcales bacterium]|nr:MBOAT family protein [Myxococcales bacterium]
MIFSSLTFVIFFLLVVFAMVKIRDERPKQWVLTLASLVFYGWWNWWFLLLIIGSAAWSFEFGRILARETDAGKRKRLLAISVAFDLGALAYFKYTNFFIQSFADAFGLSAPILDILLPAGISFFVFQTMSYVIDIYRREIPVCEDRLEFLLFVTFFPQLVAGPIVRAVEFLPQLRNPIRVTTENMKWGLQVFVLGLVQKSLVADSLAGFVDPIFKEPELWDAPTLWLGLAGYTLQIFCDFSGYSLMAIGSAKALGFDLVENFRTPYLSRSITEFWRRWHMSLSFWLRDYLYISLGGNRKGPLRTDINLVLTMFLGGLWHGAGWNFVIWGTANGIALVVHKHWSRRVPMPRENILYAGLMWAVTLLFVMLLWIPFRAGTFEITRTYFMGLFGQDGMTWLKPQVMILVVAMIIWHAFMAARSRVVTFLPAKEPFDWVPLASLMALLFLVAMFAPLDASPFIYFQF